MILGGDTLKSIEETLKSRHEPEEIRRLSGLYWYTLLGVALLVLVLVFLYSTWMLLGILNDLGATANTPPPPPPALDRAALNATVQAFEARTTQFDSLKANPPTPIADPSR